MKKVQTTIKIINGVIVPEYKHHYQTILDEAPQDEHLTLALSKPAKEKTFKQLGYLYGNKDGRKGVYASIVEYLIDKGYKTLYTEEAFGISIDVKTNIENLDKWLKDLYSKYIGSEFEKKNASQAELHEYMTWVMDWCSETLDFQVPPPQKPKENV